MKTKFASFNKKQNRQTLFLFFFFAIGSVFDFQQSLPGLTGVQGNIVIAGTKVKFYNEGKLYILKTK